VAEEYVMNMGDQGADPQPKWILPLAFIVFIVVSFIIIYGRCY